MRNAKKARKPDDFLLTAGQFGALAVNGIRKIIRQPLILLMTCSCVILIALLPLIIMFDFGEEGRLVRDGALAFHLIFGLGLSIASASVAVRDEIGRGTASILLCKPVSRSLYVLAAYVGVVVVLLMFSCMVMVAGLLSVRIASASWTIDWRAAGLLYGAVSAGFAVAAVGNACFRQPFVSRAFVFMLPALVLALVAASWFGAGSEYACCPHHGAHFDIAAPVIEWRILPGSVLITMALAVFASISIAFFTRFKPAFAVTCCAAVFFLGMISDYLFAGAPAHSLSAGLFYAMLPNWQNFWMVDALSGDGAIPWSYVAKAGVYGFLYLSGVLCLAILAFRNVEIK